MKKDIETVEDVEIFVRRQYVFLLNDKDTSSKFEHVTDLEKHFPKIFGFWRMIIFSEPSAYIGNAFDPHVKLNLQKVHFDKWVLFLCNAIDENFEGENANKVKNHAKLMAKIFESKLLKNL